MSWLKNDAKNRAWRTTLQGLGAIIAVPALIAAAEVVLRALADETGPSWASTGTAAWHAALTAAVMAVLAYLHRTKLDPSPIPSAQPPRPPGVTAVQAPATEATAGRPV